MNVIWNYFDKLTIKVKYQPWLQNRNNAHDQIMRNQKVKVLWNINYKHE